MAGKGGKKTEFRYTVDLTQLTADEKVVDPAEFADYLSARIKINGKVGGIEAAGVAVASTGSSVSVGGSKPATGSAPVSKRYIKYLTKKFLQKEQVREHVRVIADGKNDYVVKTIE